MPPTRLLLVSATALLLSACVVAPYPRHVYSEPVPAGGPYDYPDVVVDVPPPAPYVEVVPALPFAGAVWIGGYWGWSSGRHHWVPGRWAHPRPGYTYRPRAWVPRGSSWQLQGGGWVR